MKSPFPGMDPYLEARWSDVHPTLISVLKEALQSKLPPDLRARSEERVLLEDAGGEPHGYRADVAVVTVRGLRHGDVGSKVASGGAVATSEPVIVEFPERPAFDRFVQIIDVTNGNRVVTAIEVLSPWNKRRGRLNELYRKKLGDYEAGQVNVVELDLLRSDRSRFEVSQEDLPAARRTPYLACVRRAPRPGRWEVYPIALRVPLPRIPIPLREGEPDVGLDLQPLIDRVYRAGGHDDIDYAKPADPLLDPSDAAWAADLPKAARDA